MKEIIVVGETLVDIIRKANTPEKKVLGGAPLNVARTIARLKAYSGLNLRFLSSFNKKDKFGNIVKEGIAYSNIPIFDGVDSFMQTNTAIANIDKNGNSTYEFSYIGEPETIFTPKEKFNLENILGFYAGSVSSQFILNGEKKYTPILGLYKYMAENDVLTFYDPNIRPSIIPDKKIVLEIVLEYIKNSFVLKVSDEDIRWLYGEDFDLL
ncbi:MAG: PfkB family carbohydrate kinase, partial [Clostridiales Family XIII bacterium]|nr:PfkB family carbohydrate kinase [Clostridiales Family XIII bacterium]